MSLSTSPEESGNAPRDIDRNGADEADEADDAIAAASEAQHGYAPDLSMSPAEANALLAASRRSRLARFTPYIERTLGFVRDHWLAVINTLLGAFIGISLVTPLALAAGFTGPASAVFDTFRFFCAQTPSHSFFIAGYQTCLCSRCLAIYSSILIAGIALAVIRNNRQLRALPWYFWLLAMLPMALDGFTQLFGLRESNLALRLLTGGIFGLATAWFLFPQIQEAARQEQPAPNPAYATYAQNDK
jgi:uncharacterized membrane protein